MLGSQAGALPGTEGLSLKVWYCPPWAGSFFPHQSLIKRITAPQTCPQACLTEAAFQLRFPTPRFVSSRQKLTNAPAVEDWQPVVLERKGKETEWVPQERRLSYRACKYSVVTISSWLL